jgi:Ca2+-binding RTX toxin-like protein
VVVQEDPGNNAYVARVWQYDIASGMVSEAASFNPTQFLTGNANFITQDEESSGVIDVTSLLGDADTRAYLLDAQVHAATGNPATVEQGQLLAMFVGDPFLVGGNEGDNLFGSAADETLSGGNGNDTARAGSGNDAVNGGNGDDTLWGGAGNDRIYGENGHDTLIGGTGNDLLSGGNGPDYFVFDNRGEIGSDQVIDFANPDRLLASVQLADDDSDGIIQLGAGGSLALFGSSTVTIAGANALHYSGSVTIDGVSYYSYEAAGGGNSAKLAGARIYSDAAGPAAQEHLLPEMIGTGHALGAHDYMFA